MAAERAIYFACVNYLARSANLPEGLYILLMFFLYLFLMTDILTPVSQSNVNGPIFTKISGLVDGCKDLFTSLSFFDFSRNVAMATNQSRKIGVFPGPIYFVALPFGNGLQYHNSDFKRFNRMNFCTVCTIWWHSVQKYSCGGRSRDVAMGTS